MMNLYAILWPIPSPSAGVEFLNALAATVAGVVVSLMILGLARWLKR